MNATNFFSGNPDLVEVFDKAVSWDRIVRAVEGETADVTATVATWREVCDLAGRYIATEIAPRAAKARPIRTGRRKKSSSHSTAAASTIPPRSVYRADCRGQ